MTDNGTPSASLRTQLAALETKPLEGEIVSPGPDYPDIPEGGIPATGRSLRVWQVALAHVAKPDRIKGATKEALRREGITEEC